jgi:hypothetical protein
VNRSGATIENLGPPPGAHNQRFLFWRFLEKQPKGCVLLHFEAATTQTQNKLRDLGAAGYISTPSGRAAQDNATG